MLENKCYREKIDKGKKTVCGGVGCIFKVVRPGLTENDNWAKL